MNITFDDRKLGKVANDFKKLQKQYGLIRAKKITQRLSDLLDVRTLEDVRELPGRYHELVGDRKGQWACDLDGPHRLVFEPHEDPIPQDQDGKYIWAQIEGVSIIEIINYHE